MYAMLLSNGRVWDYVGDNYVHRLVQNKDDGKLVEMDEHGHRVSDEKIDSLTLEVVYSSFDVLNLRINHALFIHVSTMLAICFFMCIF